MNAYRAILTSHENLYLSGVAKFNHLLAEKIGIPSLGLAGAESLIEGPVLISVKLADCPESELCLIDKAVAYFRKAKIPFDVFFHTYSGLKTEDHLALEARRVFCGNEEILQNFRFRNVRAEALWCPELIDLSHVMTESDLNVFSFGMAHKLQVHYYEKLRKLLDESGRNYSVTVSTAFHEKAGFGDFHLISRQLHGIFGSRIHFLGFLSDEGVNYFLMRSHLLAAFFEKGVRSNNTTIYTCMRSGCALITNCDEYSPPWLKHGVNVLDIHTTSGGDFREEHWKSIGAQGKNDAEKFASWETLVKRFTEPAPLITKQDG